MIAFGRGDVCSTQMRLKCYNYKFLALLFLNIVVYLIEIIK